MTDDPNAFEGRLRMAGVAFVAVILFFAQTWLHLCHTTAFFNPWSLLLLPSILACAAAVIATPFWIGAAVLRGSADEVIYGSLSWVALVLPLLAAREGDQWMQARNSRLVPPVIAAIESYREKEGALPDELYSLVPMYLSAVPHTLSGYGRNDLWYLEAADLVAASPRSVQDHPEVDFTKAYCLYGRYLDETCEWCSFRETPGAPWVCHR
jgi:hypothetical protein